jgi:hypothetical protein
MTHRGEPLWWQGKNSTINNESILEKDYNRFTEINRLARNGCSGATLNKLYIMKVNKIISLLVLLLLAGCTARDTDHAKLNEQINVFGVALYSNADYKQINGARATEEPCLKGYERSFDALDIIIGYGFDKKIRKIMTRNPNTGIFGIRPGMSFEKGKQIINTAGFKRSELPFKFIKDNYSLTFLVDRSQNIFGLTIETID